MTELTSRQGSFPGLKIFGGWSYWWTLSWSHFVLPLSFLSLNLKHYVFKILSELVNVHQSLLYTGLYSNGRALDIVDNHIKEPSIVIQLLFESLYLKMSILVVTALISQGTLRKQDFLGQRLYIKVLDYVATLILFLKHDWGVILRVCWYYLIGLLLDLDDSLSSCLFILLYLIYLAHEFFTRQVLIDDSWHFVKN